MKKIITLVSIIALFSSCEDVREESSNVMNERAVVVTTLYSPSEHHTDITPTAFDHGILVGTDYNGNQGIRLSKNLQITSTTIPEKYGVVFQCQHGTFTIEGSDQKYRILSQKLIRSVGDTVNILYKEQYSVTYEKKDGLTREIRRVLRKLDFVDAQITKK
jgi:hypothetical protein